MRFRETGGATPQGLPIPLVRLDLVDRPSKRLYRRIGEENSCLPRHHRIEHSSLAARYDRRAESHRLEWRDAEIFNPRKDEATRACHDRYDSRSLYGAQKLNVGRSLCAIALQQRTPADDDQFLRGRGGHPDPEVDLLVGHQSGEDDVVIAALVLERRGEERLVDERVHHDRIAPVVATDAIAHEARVGDELRDLARRPDIPPPEPFRRSARHCPLPGARRREIVIETIPDVTHGRVAITEVRLSACAHTLRDAMARGDDQVEVSQVPSPDGAWKEGQKLPIVADASGDRLEA